MPFIISQWKKWISDLISEVRTIHRKHPNKWECPSTFILLFTPVKIFFLLYSILYFLQNFQINGNTKKTNFVVSFNNWKKTKKYPLTSWKNPNRSEICCNIRVTFLVHKANSIIKKSMSTNAFSSPSRRKLFEARNFVKNSILSKSVFREPRKIWAQGNRTLSLFASATNVGRNNLHSWNYAQSRA